MMQSSVDRGEWLGNPTTFFVVYSSNSCGSVHLESPFATMGTTHFSTFSHSCIIGLFPTFFLSLPFFIVIHTTYTIYNY